MIRKQILRLSEEQLPIPHSFCVVGWLYFPAAVFYIIAVNVSLRGAVYIIIIIIIIFILFIILLLFIIYIIPISYPPCLSLLFLIYFS